MVNLQELAALARKAAPSTRALFKRLKRRPPTALDDEVHALHEQVFASTNCLACANCCKTTSPALYPADVQRLARHLGMGVSTFTQRYLRQDEDGVQVFIQAPCPLLGPDNACTVYAHRPTACREYPHTNRRRFYQLLDITVKNTEICPAVYSIVQALKVKLHTS